VKLKISGEPLNYKFYYGTSGNEIFEPLSTLPSKDISTEVIYDFNQAGTEGLCCNFTGAFIGLHASGNGLASTSNGDFDWFQYTSKDDSIAPEIMSFNAKREASIVKLVTQTSWERNVSQLQFERSADGSSFLKIDELPAVGKDSSTVTNYMVSDNNPLRGMSYYRCKVNYRDGTSKYSNVEELSLPLVQAVSTHVDSENIFSAYILSEVLKYKILFSQKGSCQLHVFDSFGRLVKTENLSVEKGVYEGRMHVPDSMNVCILKVEGQDMVWVKKIVNR
jgi:hypothetical protein